MNEPSKLKLMREKPYVLLLDPATSRGAGYNAQHRLTVPLASDALVRFAIDRGVLTQAWADEKDALYPRERATWMPSGSLAGWRLIWLRNGASTIQHLQDTPSQ